MKRAGLFILLFVGLAVIGAASWWSFDRGTTGDLAVSPEVHAQLMATGASAFEANCAACHGADGRGNDVGPNIRRKSSGDIREALVDVEEMTGIEISRDEITAIASFLSGR